MCRQRAGLAFVVIFSKQPAGHGKGLRRSPAGHALKTPDVEDYDTIVFVKVKVY
jgi:hypothetical protein